MPENMFSILSYLNDSLAAYKLLALNTFSPNTLKITLFLEIILLLVVSSVGVETSEINLILDQYCMIYILFYRNFCNCLLAFDILTSSNKMSNVGFSLYLLFGII